MIPIPVHNHPAFSGRSFSQMCNNSESVMYFSRFFLNKMGAGQEDLRIVFNRGAGNLPDIGDGDILIVETSVSLLGDGYYLIQTPGGLLCRMIEHQVTGDVRASLCAGSNVHTLSEDEARALDVFGHVIWRIGMV